MRFSPCRIMFWTNKPRFGVWLKVRRREETIVNVPVTLSVVQGPFHVHRPRLPARWMLKQVQHDGIFSNLRVFMRTNIAHVGKPTHNHTINGAETSGRTRASRPLALSIMAQVVFARTITLPF